MGGVSSCQPESLPNNSVWECYEGIVSAYNNSPNKNSSDLINLVNSLVLHFRRLPPETIGCPLNVSGKNTFKLFYNNIYFNSEISRSKILTKISFANSCISGKLVLGLIDFVRNETQLQELDISNNNLGDSAAAIILQVVNHPNISALSLENCGVGSGSVKAISYLLKFNRKIKTLKINELLNVGDSEMDMLRNNFKNNGYILECNLFDKQYRERNELINGILEGMCNASFKRHFSQRHTSIKVSLNKNSPRRLQKSALFSKFSPPINQRFKVGKYDTIGKRSSMEDVMTIIDKCPTDDSIFYAVFDGHGGSMAAKEASEVLPEKLIMQFKSAKDSDTAITKAFNLTQIDLKDQYMELGTTACCAFIQGNNLTVANVGDTRCVLSRNGKALRLTVDHKATVNEEIEYIIAHGGTVKNGRLNGILAVSRAIGDGQFGKALNTCPHIAKEELFKTDELMVLACDGVWDVMSDQEAIDIALKHIDNPDFAAKEIVETALEKGSLDNISVMVVILGDSL